MKNEIELILATEKDIDLLKEYNIKLTKDVYIIRNDGKDRGLIEYTTPGDYSLKIEYIEILKGYLKQGIATSVINYLKEKYVDSEIYGDSIPTEASTKFWESVGAELEYEEDMEHYIDNNICIPFYIA